MNLSVIYRKLEIQFRARLLTWPPRIVINEFPKSGGTWLSKMLAEVTGYTFPQNRPPGWGPIILHGHFYSAVGIRKSVVLWRDGRDVMVSWYHHCYFPNDAGNEAMVSLMRRELPFKDYEAISENLPIFIERAMTRPIWPHYTWPRFVERWWQRPRTVPVHYERLLTDCMVQLSVIIGALGFGDIPQRRLEEAVERYRFSVQVKRAQGCEDKGSFLRKGVAGDWKNYFTAEASEVFDHYAGQALIALGYESDRSWRLPHKLR